MPYPDAIDQFNEKLNKSETVYVIEEEVSPVNGVYEGILAHDNIIDSSVRVYTGSKLTGTKIDNFILSIPSGMDWKRSIKIFSNAEKLYTTYESYGDQVEAEDINRLQDSMTATQTEVDRYKTANDLVVSNTVNRVTTVENNKAEKTYVDTELLKKADKVNTYTKTETDARIQAVVDAAPAALDTLNELAAALNDDPNFASTMTNELSKKVDKVTGKQLSTEDYSTAEKSKLAGIETNANKYIHPSTHPATMIVEDTTHRFATDDEKANWNGKLDATANAVSASKLATGRSIALSGDVTGSVSFDGSANVTITASVVDDSHAHIISNVDGLQTALDAKETPSGAQAKVDTHANRVDNPHAVTKSQVGLGNVDNVQQAAKADFDSHNNDNTRHITAAERTTWNAKASTATATQLANGLMSSADKTKLDGVAANANNYVHPTTHPPSIIVQDASNLFVTDAEKSTWNGKQNALGFTPENSAKKGVANGYASLDASAKIPIAQIPDSVVTQDELGSAGYGDMLKSMYDSNGDGVVDAAGSVPWTGITGKPSTFTPSTHTHDVLSVKGDNYKDGLALPSTYDRGQTLFFSNSPTNKFNGTTYCTVHTIKGYNNMAVVQYIYPYNVDSPIYYRYGLYNSDSWKEWRTIETKGAKTWNDLKGV